MIVISELVHTFHRGDLYNDELHDEAWITMKNGEKRKVVFEVKGNDDNLRITATMVCLTPDPEMKTWS